MLASVFGTRQRAATKPMMVTSAKKKTQTASGTGSISVMVIEAPIDEPGQERGDRHPEKLIPIEKRKTEKPRLGVVIERHPEEPDIGNEEQPEPRIAGASFGRKPVHDSQAQGANCTSNPMR